MPLPLPRGCADAPCPHIHPSPTTTTWCPQLTTASRRASAADAALDAYVTADASPERLGVDKKPEASASASSLAAALVRDEDFLVLDASKLPLEL